MKFLMLGREISTLDYVVKVDAGSVDDVLKVAVEMKDDITRDSYTPFFIINLENGECHRINRDRDLNWKANDTAFSIVGVATPDDYMIENESALEGNSSKEVN